MNIDARTVPRGGHVLNYAKGVIPMLALALEVKVAG
jgi:hypothetical protein